MIAATHLATGAATCVVVDNYLFPTFNDKSKLIIVFSAGILGHMILDAFPHEEYSNSWPWPLLIAESLAVCLFVFSIRKSIFENLLIFVGMTGAALPDFLTRFDSMTYLHDLLHVYHDKFEPGFIVPFSFQIGIALLAIIYVKTRPR